MAIPLGIILVGSIFFSIIDESLTTVRVLQCNFAAKKIHPKAPPKRTFEENVGQFWAHNKAGNPRFVSVWKVLENDNVVFILHISKIIKEWSAPQPQSRTYSFKELGIRCDDIFYNPLFYDE